MHETFNKTKSNAYHKSVVCVSVAQTIDRHVVQHSKLPPLYELPQERTTPPLKRL